MRKEVFICDKCQKQKASVQSYSYETGIKILNQQKTEMETKSIDLCKACVTEIIKEHYMGMIGKAGTEPTSPSIEKSGSQEGEE